MIKIWAKDSFVVTVPVRKCDEQKTVADLTGSTIVGVIAPESNLDAGIAANQTVIDDPLTGVVKLIWDAGVFELLAANTRCLIQVRVTTAAGQVQTVVEELIVLKPAVGVTP